MQLRVHLLQAPSSRQSSASALAPMSRLTLGPPSSKAASPGSANEANVEAKMRLQTELIDTALSEPRIFAVLLEICPNLLAEYLSLG